MGRLSKGRTNILFALTLCLIASLFVSRALLSVFTITFTFFCLLQGSFSARIKSFIKSPVLWSLSLLFFIPLVSGLWSSDKNEWLDVLRVKLPFLFLPLAFAHEFSFTKKKWKTLALFFIGCAVAGSVFSVAHYTLNLNSIHENYERAKLMLTPLSGDHIRFSLLVAIAFLATIFLVEKEKQKWLSILLVMILVWFALYLHLLAARTGLLCLYLVVISYLVKTIIRRKQWQKAMAMIIGVSGIAILSLLFFPTLQKRISYFKWDLSFARTKTYQPGTTDGNRILSMQAGWWVLEQNPLGVGAGDVRENMDDWYQVYVPQMVASDKLYPSSEWLVHGAFAGWPGIILFSLALVIPFFIKSRSAFYFRMLQVLLIASILFDTGLSTQYGIFIHSFFLLLLWQCDRYRAEKLTAQNAPVNNGYASNL